MKNIFFPGDAKHYSYTITHADVAAFQGEVVHEVCSTFALAREIEWCSRLFVLDMKDDDEEGIGTLLEIRHKSPAFVGETIAIEAIVESLNGKDLICKYQVKAGNRLVADGRTGQKVMKKNELARILDR